MARHPLLVRSPIQIKRPRGLGEQTVSELLGARLMREVTQILSNLQSIESEWRSRVAQLEKVKPQKGEVGSIGPRGLSVRGPKGEKGDKGDQGEKGDVGNALDIDKSESLMEKLALRVLSKVVVKNGRDGIAGRDGTPGKDAVVDYDRIIKEVTRLTKKQKLKTEDIDGFEQTLHARIRQLYPTYIHGGGDTVAAGNNITITNVDGKKVISSTGGGTNISTQYALTAVQSGSDVTIDLTQLTNYATLNQIITLYRNNIPQTEGASYNFTVSGTVATIFNADAAEVFNITYSYS